ncbi:unnamed protein product [Rhizophagus irregularis]|nr:unnamed protein product [Rhizophagus irregularis]
MEEGSGRLLTNGTKIHRVDFRRLEKGELRFVNLGCLECLPKNKKTKIRFGWASEEQKTQRFVSDGFPKNGKGKTFIKIRKYSIL